MAVHISPAPLNIAMELATENLYLDKGGNVTNDPNESTSVLIAEGSPMRPDVVAKLDADGFKTKTVDFDADAPEEQKAQTKPQANKAVTAKETK